MKVIYLVAGYTALLLGALGVVLPLLPTTPFVLLAAWLFAKGSPRAHQWIKSNHWTGKIISNYVEGKGMTFVEKIVTLLTLAVALTIGMVISTSTHLDIILVVVLLGVSWHILAQPTRK